MANKDKRQSKNPTAGKFVKAVVNGNTVDASKYLSEMVQEKTQRRLKQVLKD